MEERTYTPKKVIKHSKYNGRTKQNDIALMILPQAVNYGATVNAACLPEPNEVFAGIIPSST